MAEIRDKSRFYQGLGTLGFDTEDESLFFIDLDYRPIDPQIQFHLERAKDFQAASVFLRRQLNGCYKPQIYLYDYTGQIFVENEITDIQKKIWSSGEVPLACIFYDTEIKILDCTTHIQDNNTPTYLIKNLSLVSKAHKLYNQQFAIKVKSGLFWQEEDLKSKFKFQNSAYDILIQYLRSIIITFNKTNVNSKITHKLIIQSILIKYFEERVDSDGNRVFTEAFFSKFDGANTFCNVLRKQGQCLNLFDELHNLFKGNIFDWSDEDERKELIQTDLSELANLLDGNIEPHSQQISIWRYYAFNYVPVELISRLYEEFLGENKKEKGLYYTPSHLAKLLVDESMPLKNYEAIDLENYRVLDPACGSGIFLVIAYKRLVQWWRLKNNLNRPNLSVLKKLLQNSIYGVDEELAAVRLSAFSLCLALCDELTPKQIIEQLKFEDLTQSNIVQSDFFVCTKLGDRKFDLIIGNPPFNRGAIRNYSQDWLYDDIKVKIPQGQIALKFLSEALVYLKKGGLQCLIIKASGLLYNSSSENYKKLLFSKLNVIQVLDFSALARNKSLWDNGADVASAAIFIKNEEPDFKKNILHLTFRRTKATKERIVFEIDDYDLHFINRQSAIENEFIWKNNLLGGGRIKTIIEKFYKDRSLQEFLDANDCIAEEGYIIGTNGKWHPKKMFEVPTLPTEAIDERGIDYSKLQLLDPTINFVKACNEICFTAPNVLIWENIGEKKLPAFFNNRSFTFKDKIVGIGSKSSNKTPLKTLVKSLEKNSDFYRFYIFATSGQTLINLNTAILKVDLMSLPFTEDEFQLSDLEKSVIDDVNTHMQDFIRHGEKSKIIKAINKEVFRKTFETYGDGFCKVLNLIYEDQQRRFRLCDVAYLCDKLFIAVIFKYDDKKEVIKYHQDNSAIDLPGLTNNEISRHLSVNRIIKLYPKKDVIIFIKPNQLRYWISLIAYRDADKCFSDLSKLGY